MRNLDRQLQTIEAELVDMRIDHALKLAHAVPRSDFAVVLMNALPSPEPGKLTWDFDKLSLTELELVAGSAAVEYIASIPLDEAFALSQGEPEATRRCHQVIGLR